MLLTILRFAAAAMASLLVLPPSLSAQGQTKIKVIVFDFDGPEKLGVSLAAVLQAQIWRTFRRYPKADPSKGDFGRGTIRHEHLQPPKKTHDAIAGVISEDDHRAQIALWGSVRQIDEKALVLASLTLPPSEQRSSRNEQWSISARGVKGSKLMVEVDLPQRAYSFHSVTLPATFVAKYTLLDGIPITEGKGSGRVIRNFGKDWLRVANEQDYTRLKDSSGRRGWVHLPEIGTQRTEIVDFVGGLIRIFRADWEGAIDLLTEVVKNSRTPAALQIDSYLLLIRAKTELGLDAGNEINAAERLGPGSKAVAQYIAMHYVHRCFNSRPPRNARLPCRPSDRDALANVVQRSASLFRAGDPWLDTVATLSK